MSLQKNTEILFNLCKRHQLTDAQKQDLLSHIHHIFIHDEFQRRMSPEFFHHDEITLGEHILEDTIVTYLLSQKIKESDYDYKTALKISMMHDLYGYPWQNNPHPIDTHFCNKHGFRHPIEAILNAIKWFPEEFTDEKTTEKLIDGVIHHMFPFPVRKFTLSEKNDMEIANFEIIKQLNDSTKKQLEILGSRKSVGPYSICPSLYKEGKVMSNADKIVSFSNFKNSNISAISSLITGNNKNIKQKQYSKKR